MKAFNLNNKYTIYKNGEIYSDYSNKFLSVVVDNSGYKRVKLVVELCKQKKFLLHRLLAIHFIPNPNNYEYINHIDGNKLNNNIGNLEWCTSSYNQKHAYSSGLKKIPKGSLNGRSILLEDDVKDIYKLLLKGTPMTTVAKSFGVGESTISNIKYKRTWTSVLVDFPDCVIKGKSVSLSDNAVHIICKLFEDGLQPKAVMEHLSCDITYHQVYDLRRRRGFKHITKMYNW